MLYFKKKKNNDCLINNYSNNVSSFHTINLINKTYIMWKKWALLSKYKKIHVWYSTL